MGVYLIFSASLMLRVNLWLTEKVGDRFQVALFWSVFLAVAAAFVIYALFKRLGVRRTVAVFAVFSACYLLSRMQAYFSDKTHILSYGLLGLLSMRDMARPGGRFRLKGLLVAFGFVLLISSLDEIFQSFRPGRTGDIGDVLTNAVSGALGMCLFSAIDRRSGYP